MLKSDRIILKNLSKSHHLLSQLHRVLMDGPILTALYHRPLSLQLRLSGWGGGVSLCFNRFDPLPTSSLNLV
jgi:hypothetical protein